MESVHTQYEANKQNAQRKREKKRGELYGSVGGQGFIQDLGVGVGGGGGEPSDAPHFPGNSTYYQFFDS